MEKSLIIVESPAKAKTISKFLDKNFLARPSYGHVMDLPAKGMGVDLENNFKPVYEIIPGKNRVIKGLKKDAKKAEKIFLATDPDREGEAISWHLAQILDMPSKIKRAVFYEVTKEKVLEAVAEPEDIDIDKVYAQQARRILDRIVGYTISPILWKKVGRGLSAGRVQSVAMRLILEREEKIKNFISEEYWTVHARFRTEEKKEFMAKLYEKDNKKIDIKKEEQAREILKELEGRGWTVLDVKKTSKKRNPPPPFSTSLLQQEAARKLGFTAYRTMRGSQELYEGIELGEEGPVGLITYMRTDSFRISPDFQSRAREYIKEKFGGNFIPGSPNYFPSRKGAQEAHEAIRPTSLTRPPEAVKPYLSRELFMLYELIWQRVLASQMTPAIFEETAAIIESKPYTFRAQGVVTKFPGFKIIYEEGTEEEDKDKGTAEELPHLNEGEEVALISIKPEQHFTKPPPPYSEAMLIKALEEEGIGRPSTYAVIIHTIEQREYVKRIRRKLYPTELGLTVTKLLIENFPKIMDIGFTADLETQLDSIEEGKKKWKLVLKDFYDPFKDVLSQAERNMKDLKHEKIETDVPCLRCGKPMVIRWGRHGKFFACSAYPECRYTQATGEREVEKSELKCKECGSQLLVKNGKFGRFLACIRYPECKFTQPFTTGLKCPKDNCIGEIVERKTKKGRTFFGCSSYPKCEFFTWQRPVIENCPLCGARFLVEKTAAGGKKQKVCVSKGCGYKKEILEDEEKR